MLSPGHRACEGSEPVVVVLLAGEPPVKTHDSLGLAGSSRYQVARKGAIKPLSLALLPQLHPGRSGRLCSSRGNTAGNLSTLSGLQEVKKWSEYKAEHRAKRAEAGLKRFEWWLTPEHGEKVRRFIGRLVKRRAK